METQIVISLISSGSVLLGTIITVVAGLSRLRTDIETRQKLQQEQIDEMKTDIKEHNNYAKKMLVIENELMHIKELLEEVRHNAD